MWLVWGVCDSRSSRVVNEGVASAGGEDCVVKGICAEGAVLGKSTSAELIEPALMDLARHEIFVWQIW